MIFVGVKVLVRGRGQGLDRRGISSLEQEDSGTQGFRREWVYCWDMEGNEEGVGQHCPTVKK